MIALSPQTKIFVHVDTVDFRNGLDGLIGITKSKIKEDPFSGALFLFKGKKGRSIKAICYDGQGFWLFMKRLSEGKFQHWPKARNPGESIKLLSRELQVLLWNGDPSRVSMKPDWKKLDL
jgi:transposase